MFAHPDGDHMTLLNIFRGYAAVLPHDVCSDFSSKDRNGKPYGSNRNSSTAARSWCDEHFLSLKVLERAAEIRTCAPREERVGEKDAGQQPGLTRGKRFDSKVK